MTASSPGLAGLPKFQPDLSSEVSDAVAAAQGFLRRIQKADGHWCGPLEGDTILESEYILAMYYLGAENDNGIRKAGNRIRHLMLPDGGWNIYPGGDPDPSASVKAYFVLKLLGDDPEAPHMRKSREVIRELGGLSAINSFTRIYLAIFGQYPWEKCPAVPPEIILLPNWFPVNYHELSAWSRGIVIPLSIIWAKKPLCKVPERAAIGELWTTQSPAAPERGFWRRFFRMTDAVLRFLERRKWHPLRERALQVCENWMLRHFQKSDGIGAIFPPIVNSIIALHAMGYDKDSGIVRSQVQELEKLKAEDANTVRLSPCYSPVWDTALTITAMAASGIPATDPDLGRAAGWVLEKEVKEIGDWKVKNPEGNPGGWYFEYANEFYPDVDDTFQVLIALSRVRLAGAAEKPKQEAAQRALQWLFTMQNRDGGWGSFDRNCDRHFLTCVPFADHNAMIDPSTSDLTARGLEALSASGVPRNHPRVRKAIAFLLGQQERDGTWFGRWGCNYIYGTWLALRGLRCVGEDMSLPRYQKAAEWLRRMQNEDGGWGELPRSSENPEVKGRGPSTPSQTSWALMALMSSGDRESASMLRGVEYLLKNQFEDGSWRDDYWTGTGFPTVFYLRYHLYAVYFPLQALGIYLQERARR
ncbi:MAG TPA: squalene--hopene cyclase [Acidobacteriota bacterium]|nr:squalene--hopene cyclase [Acidobacteriota bacterium]